MNDFVIELLKFIREEINLYKRFIEIAKTNFENNEYTLEQYDAIVDCHMGRIIELEQVRDKIIEML